MLRSSRARLLLFIAVSLLLIATALLIALWGPPRQAAGAGETRKLLPPALSPGERRQAERQAAALQAAREDMHDDDPRPPPGLKEAGRRFLRFYIPYEVGKVDRRVSAGLRAAASPDFAAELLGNGPRIPPGIGRAPAEAELLGLDAIAVGEDRRAGRIVARLRRRGDLEAAAFEFHRVAGRWVVTGVAG